MKRHKISAILLAFVMLLTGCMLLASVSCDKVPEASQAETISPIDVDSQIDIIAANYDSIISEYLCEAYTGNEEPESRPFAGTSFAVTDLNHNGRLELIISCVQGSGIYSYTRFYEISEDHSSLERLCVNGEDVQDMAGDFLPLANFEDRVGAYDCYMKDGEYYYLVQNYISGGWSNKIYMYHAYSFGNGVTSDLIGGCEFSAVLVDDFTTVKLWLYGPPDVLFKSDEEYFEYMDQYWSGYERQDQCEIQWVELDLDGDFEAGLYESYNGFNPHSDMESSVLYNYHDYFDNFYSVDGEYDFEYVIQVL